MEINDDLREMLKELGHAINESISGSGRVHDSIQRIRDEGYNLYMVLDAKVGVNRRSSRTGSRRRASAAAESGKAVAAIGEQAARLDMTLKAVPDVAERVRAIGAEAS